MSADFAKEQPPAGHTLAPFEIVPVYTMAGAQYGSPDYVDNGCGMGREATLQLSTTACMQWELMAEAGTFLSI